MGATDASASRCGLCGGPNACALALPEAERPSRCWCVEREFPPELLASADPSSCLCVRCLDESGQSEGAGASEGAGKLASGPGGS